MARDGDDRAEQVTDEVVRVLDQRLIQTSPCVGVCPEPGCGALDVAVHDADAAAVERMGGLDVGPAPSQPVLLELQAAEER
jgi:hypothetical protein